MVADRRYNAVQPKRFERLRTRQRDAEIGRGMVIVWVAVIAALV